MQVKKLMAALLLIVMVISMSIPSFAEDEIISKGASYTVTPDSPVENAYPNLVYNEPGGYLTDGKKGSDNVRDSEYIHLYRGTYYSVVIDLGEKMSVTGISLGEYQAAPAGITFSRHIYLSVSDDGENFKLVGQSVDEDRIKNGGSGRKDFKVEADGTYAARYVCVKFSSDIHTYVDEISVYGSKSVVAGAKEVTPDKPFEPVGFKGAVDGVNHICLIYTGEYYRGAQNSTGKVSEEQILPYLCYIGTDGQVKDSMFDSMLFLPLAPTDASDGPYSPKSFTQKAGWEAYLNATIGKGFDKLYNLAALNAQVGAQREKLGLAADYKYPVYISVPYIDPSDVMFGSINGKNVTPNTAEARQAIVEWFVDLVIEKFNSAGFDNLKLNGLYWHSELVQYKYGQEELDLIKHFNEYTHSKKYSTIWIPYYCSPGFERATELGFDAAVVQTGYAFPRAEGSETGDAKPGACDNAAAQANKYGLGTEIEVSSLDEKGYQRYYKYLQAAYAGGYSKDGLFMYYQAGGPGVYYHASKAAENTPQRKGYDLTYQFVKGTFTSDAPVIREGQQLIVKKGARAYAQLDVQDNDSSPADLKLIEFNKPEQIKVSVEGTGFTIINTKDCDFVGDTELSFRVGDGFNVSDLVTVKIKVVEDCFTVGTFNTELRENNAVLYDEGETTGTPDGAFEVVVVDDVITKVGGNNNAIPANGYVLAASGECKAYLEANAKKGRAVMLDRLTGNVIFTDEKPVKPDEPGQVGGGNGLVPLIVAGCATLGLVAAAIIVLLKRKK